MFRNTLRMLEQLDGTMTYKMDVLPDEDGYDRPQHQHP